jgi:hypothetical protein
MPYTPPVGLWPRIVQHLSAGHTAWYQRAARRSDFETGGLFSATNTVLLIDTSRGLITSLESELLSYGCGQRAGADLAASERLSGRTVAAGWPKPLPPITGDRCWFCRRLRIEDLPPPDNELMDAIAIADFLSRHGYGTIEATAASQNVSVKLCLTCKEYLAEAI